MGDIASSKIYYKSDLNEQLIDDKLAYDKSNELFDNDQTEKTNDYAVLTFVSHDTGYVHNVLIIFEIKKEDQPESEKLATPIVKETVPTEQANIGRQLKTTSLLSLKTDNERSPRGYNEKKFKESISSSLSNFIKIQPRKTIFVIPGEAIKLTSNELKPKNLSADFNPDNLVYFLVSGNLKYGELKLKKAFSYDEAVPSGWTQVNDIYLEKTVKEFSQKDLDNGNVWYEPLSDFSSTSINKKISNENNGCNQNASVKVKKCPLGEICDDSLDKFSNDCDNILSFPSLNSAPGPKYDHCMFEVSYWKHLLKYLNLRYSRLETFFYRYTIKSN